MKTLKQILLGYIDEAIIQMDYSNIYTKRALDFCKFLLDKNIPLDKEISDDEYGELQKEYIETQRGLGL